MSNIIQFPDKKFKMKQENMRILNQLSNDLPDDDKLKALIDKLTKPYNVTELTK